MNRTYRTSSRPFKASRRQFVRTMAAAPLALGSFRTRLQAGKRSPASERIGIGLIGAGKIGGEHLRGFCRFGDVQVIAVCDVVRERRDHFQKMVNDHYAKESKGDYRGCQQYSDFRELLARPEIDAVVIATPDHWHAIPCIHAAKARKDIYCEKPLTHSIAEGRKIVEAVRANQVIFQTGSQQRSEFGGRFRKAVEYVRNQAIGKIRQIRIGVGSPARPCDLPETEVPEGTDWDFWLGPAPKRGYNEILCPKGVHNHFPDWRSFREYGGGGLADMGAHHFDIAQWALDADAAGPVRIEPPEQASAGKGLRLIYADGVVMLHNVFEGERTDCLFEGEKGSISVSRGSISSDPASILESPLEPGGFRAYPSSNHRRNWLDCIRNRTQTICPAEIGHRSATVCHLANIGYRLARPLSWDPKNERFDDEEANRLAAPIGREPWNE